MARLPQGCRKRPDGSLEKRFTIEGKRYSVYGKTAKEILEKEHDLRNKVKNSGYKKNEAITLDEYVQEWSEDRQKTTKGSSLRVYTNRYNLHISPVLGKKKVQAIEKREVTLLQNKLKEKGLSVNNINSCILTLQIILNDAVKDEIIEKSPAAKIRKVKEMGPDPKKASDTIHRALTEAEQKDFMEIMKKSFFYEISAMMLATGMRVGEAAALTWSDIDYIKGVIHVTKTVSVDRNNKITINTPKSEAGMRDIPLTNTVKDILQQERHKNMIYYGESVKLEQNIFMTTEGTLISSNCVNQAINRTLNILKKQGIIIEHFSCHAFRDTFATRYIEQGGSPQTLKTILGHSSLAMTMDLYAHVLPSTKKEEMERIQIIV